MSMAMKNARAFAGLGINRVNDSDFNDDGNNFYGYEYKGLPISYSKNDGQMYFSVRVDSLNDFSFSDYHDKDWYKLCDKFNGVSEIDKIDLLIALEKIVEGVRTLREEIKNMELDFSIFNARRDVEIAMIDEAIENVKNNFNWLEAKTYVVSSVKDNVKSLSGYKKRLLAMEEANTPAMRDNIRRAEKGCILVSNDSWFIERLTEHVKNNHN